MLSGETSVGVDPVNVVETMEKIIEKAENYRKPKLGIYDGSNNELKSVCKSAISLANEINVKSIVTYTKTGKSPRYLSSYRVNAEIIAITENSFINTYNHFLWGVLGIKIKRSLSGDEITDFTLKEMSKAKALKKKDKVILLLSSSRDKFKSADTIKVIVK
jgi:pyruvate kinase